MESSCKFKLNVPSCAEALHLIPMLNVTKNDIMFLCWFSKINRCALLDLALQTQTQRQHGERHAWGLIQDQGEGWEKERSMGVDTGHNARCSANMFQRAEEWIEGRWEYVVGHGQAPTAPAHFWSIVACWGKKKSWSFPDFSVITQLLKTCLNVEERWSCKSKSQEATGDSLPILGPHSAMVSCRWGRGGWKPPVFVPQ